MKTVNSHNSNSYASTGSVVTVLLFSILAISCNVPVTSDETPPETLQSVARDALDINSATAAELEKLPGVGPKLARKIVEFRARNGPFQKTEHLILVAGMSDSRFRALRPFVRIK